MALEPITRQEKIIAGQDLTPITRMEKFLKQFGGGGSGLPTGGAPYQQLVTDGEGNAKWEDRLAYGATVISWDGDTTDRVNAAGAFYKVSDLTPSKKELIGGKLSAVLDGTRTLIADSFMEGENYLIADSAIISYADGVPCYDYTLPEKGIYFSYNDPFEYISGLSWGEVKFLDFNLLPKNYNVLFTMDASGENVTCNCTYDELSAWLSAGTPIVAHFFYPNNYCATIQAFTLNDSNIGFLFTALNSSNGERTYKYTYDSNGRIYAAIQ